MFSPSQSSFRLDSDLSIEVCIDTPDDTFHGELDYDPFVFEMGCIGIMLVTDFQVSHARKNPEHY
jgi:hypothetical protein